MDICLGIRIKGAKVTLFNDFFIVPFYFFLAYHLSVFLVFISLKYGIYLSNSL
jgi:hypothetical protein